MFCSEHGTLDYCPECLNESDESDGFNIGDVVEIESALAVVVGVIHDDERIFVDFGDGEVEFPFSVISDHWVKK